jgi:hypothetical protein
MAVYRHGAFGRVDFVKGLTLSAGQSFSACALTLPKASLSTDRPADGLPVDVSRPPFPSSPL